MRKIAAFCVLLSIILSVFPYAFAQSASDASFEVRLHLTYSERLLTPSDDDESVKRTIFYFADLLGSVSYSQVKAYLEESGIEYTGEIGENTLAVLHASLVDGGLYFCFYPLDTSEASTEFGDPEKEMLSCVEYTRDDKWITITDELHIGDVLYRIGDKSANPVAHYVSSITSILEFYNSKIGGFIILDEKSAE